VKAARAVASTTPGLAETIAREWCKAARFYVRFGITETPFRSEVPPELLGTGDDSLEGWTCSKTVAAAGGPLAGSCPPVRANLQP
jgi:hypothetical protein